MATTSENDHRGIGGHGQVVTRKAAGKLTCDHPDHLTPHFVFKNHEPAIRENREPPEVGEVDTATIRALLRAGARAEAIQRLRDAGPEFEAAARLIEAGHDEFVPGAVQVGIRQGRGEA